MAADPKQQNVMNLEEPMGANQLVTFWGFWCKGIRHQASAAHVALYSCSTGGEPQCEEID